MSDARAWWGVDPGTKRVAIGSVTEDGERAVISQGVPTKLEGAERLVVIRQITREMAGLALATGDLPRPGHIYVEQPSGKHVNHSLQFAVGVIIEGVASAVPGVGLDIINPQSWKKEACGRGDIYKPDANMRAAGAKYGVLVWANENGYDGSSWDEADALGIAEAARRRVALTTA